MTAQLYLDALAHALGDLPEAERSELLDDLRDHLNEIEAERDLRDALGDPAAYAQEFRSAAGYATDSEPVRLTLFERGRREVVALRSSRAWRAVAEFLPELRPAWWVARAWLVVATIGMSLDFPVPDVSGSKLLGLIMLVVLVPLSVTLGRRARSGERRGTNAALTVVGVLFALILPVSAQTGGETYTVVGPSGFQPTPAWTIHDVNGRLYQVSGYYTHGPRPRLLVMCPMDDPPDFGDNFDIECRSRLDPPPFTTARPPSPYAPTTAGGRAPTTTAVVVPTTAPPATAPTTAAPTTTAPTTTTG